MNLHPLLGWLLNVSLLPRYRFSSKLILEIEGKEEGEKTSLVKLISCLDRVRSVRTKKGKGAIDQTVRTSISRMEKGRGKTFACLVDQTTMPSLSYLSVSPLLPPQTARVPGGGGGPSSRTPKGRGDEDGEEEEEPGPN